MHSVHEEYTSHCTDCEKVYNRKDNLKRHKDTCTKSIRIKEEEDLYNNIKTMTEDYNARVLKGKLISKILNDDPSLKEEALSQDYKDALKTYVNSSLVSMNDIVLRPWQQELSTQFESPSNREIIWVSGSVGD